MKQLDDLCEMLDAAKIKYDYDESDRNAIYVIIPNEETGLDITFQFDHGGHLVHIEALES